ncbi:hypothetical protein SLEP1_g32332 [Rubroshorea leprosula]|uniref:Uncharacterized protein n=1 Tax=Rubroshorea leprosula TaxID=152421 RepID=A0AAV5KD66_9ROSI|nr:hypothetical protein SLEP1_g32332 [Rubroshorea leprosula]
MHRITCCNRRHIIRNTEFFFRLQVFYLSLNQTQVYADCSVFTSICMADSRN